MSLQPLISLDSLRLKKTMPLFKRTFSFFKTKPRKSSSGIKNTGATPGLQRSSSTPKKVKQFPGLKKTTLSASEKVSPNFTSAETFTKSETAPKGHWRRQTAPGTSKEFQWRHRTLFSESASVSPSRFLNFAPLTASSQGLSRREHQRSGPTTKRSAKTSVPGRKSGWVSSRINTGKKSTVSLLPRVPSSKTVTKSSSTPKVKGQNLRAQDKANFSSVTKLLSSRIKITKSSRKNRLRALSPFSAARKVLGPGFSVSFSDVKDYGFGRRREIFVSDRCVLPKGVWLSSALSTSRGIREAPRSGAVATGFNFPDVPHRPADEGLLGRPLHLMFSAHGVTDGYVSAPISKISVQSLPGPKTSQKKRRSLGQRKGPKISQKKRLLGQRSSKGQKYSAQFAPGTSGSLSLVSGPLPLVQSPESLQYLEALQSIENSFYDFKKWRIFENSYHRYLSQIYRGKAFIYPTSRDNFHWPRVRSKKKKPQQEPVFVVDPPKLWVEESLKSHRQFPFFLKYSHFFRAFFGSKRAELSRDVSHLFTGLLYQFYYYSAFCFHRLTPILVPQGFCFNSLEQKFFKFFFRPLWDFFDESLDSEHCLDDSVYGYQQWLRFFVSILPKAESSLREVFLFQFVEREHRFWFRFFYNLAHPQREKSPLDYLELFYAFLQGNPSWTLYLLNRLTLILPFLPPKERSFFFRLGGHVRVYCQKVFQRLQSRELLKKPKPRQKIPYLSRIIRSWSRKQTYYGKHLRAKTLQLPAVAVVRRFAAKKAFKRWLFLHYPKLCPWNLKQKSSLGKRALSQSSSRSISRSPEETSCSQKIFVTFNYKVCWSLLLFWFLVYFLKISVQRPLLFSQNLINAYGDFFPVSLGDPFSSLYSYFLRYSSTDDSLYSLACAFWTKNAHGRSRKIFRYRRARQFFIWNYPRRKDSPYTIYRRYQYMRQLPFSSFGYFWSRLAKTNKTKFFPRRSPGASSSKVVLSPTTLLTPLPFVTTAPVYGSRPQVPLVDPTMVVGSYRFDRIANTRFKN